MSNQAYLITLDILENYKKVRQFIYDFLSKKILPMLEQHPRYKLFDFEHPYFDMDTQTKDVVKSFENMLKNMLDLEIDGSTIRRELEKMTSFNILKETSDENIERLRKL